MSIFLPVEARCTQCGTSVKASLAASVNADRRPDLRQAILDGTFQSMACPNCGTQVRLPAHLTYMDMARGLWILVEDTGQLDHWRGAEAEAEALYSRAFGRDAPDIQRSMGDTIAARLVFGWAALREKILANEAGLDDVVLELLKISVLRNVPNPPMNDVTELRLIDVEAAQLRLRWIDAMTEQGLSDLPLDRELYDDLAADPASWTVLQAELQSSLFVDMKRVILN